MRTPNPLQAFRDFIKRQSDDIYFPLPGKITKFADGKAEVEPQVQFPYIDESGATVQETLPVIAGVPVLFPSLGPFFLSMPVEVGSTGLLLFAGCAVDAWLSTGQLAPQQQPRKGALTDAFFLPGLRFFGDQIPISDRLLLGSKDGAQIGIATNGVHLGDPNAGALIALANKVDAALDAIRIHTNTHIHPGNGAPPGPIPAPVPAIPTVAANGVFAKE